MGRALLLAIVWLGCSRPAPAPEQPSARRSAASGEDRVALGERKLLARGVPRDLTGARQLFEAACHDRVPRACGLWAWVDATRWTPVSRGRRIELARLCDEGDADACTGLAAVAFVEPTTDLKEAGTWSEKGCAAGNTFACHMLQHLLARGTWTEEGSENHERLAELAKQQREAACRAGDWGACPEGGPEFMKLARQACAASDYGACSEIAENADDLEEGLRAATRACTEGRIPGACGLMGDALRDGRGGAAPDPERARAAYRVACDGGKTTACDRLADPLLGGGCPAIDDEKQPHLSLERLPRLRGETFGGGRFDSRQGRARGSTTSTRAGTAAPRGSPTPPRCRRSSAGAPRSWSSSPTGPGPT